MRNLIIILLVSILGCGLVLKHQNYNSTKLLTEIMEGTERDAIHIFNSIHFQYLLKVFHYRGYGEHLDILETMDNYLDKKAKNLIIPSTKQTAESESENWKTINNEYYKDMKTLFYGDNFEHYFSIHLPNNFYHKNKTFKELLKIIRKNQLQNSRIVVMNFFMEKTKGTRLCYGYYTLGFKHPIQVNKTARLPITYFSGCVVHQALLRKMWINDELIFDFAKDSEMPYPVILTYQGEKSTKIKIAVQQSYSAPIIYRNYDFGLNIPSCVKN